MAADYVLGLLQGRARARFERRMHQDASLERRVWQLRERLEPLLAATPKEPSAQLWQRIERELGWNPKPRRRWSWMERLSLAAAALSLVVAIGVGVYVQTRPSPPSGRVLAILHNAEHRQLLRVALTPDGHGVTVTALADVSVPAGHSLELWALPKQGAPIAVGLLTPEPGRAQRYALPARPGRLHGFAVSVEPPGGSPQAGPTGPIIYQGIVAAVARVGGRQTDVG